MKLTSATNPLARLRHHVTSAIERGEAKAITALTVPDPRYTITFEWCGHPEQRHVARFCGDWIGQALTIQSAVALTVSHNTSRLA